MQDTLEWFQKWLNQYANFFPAADASLTNLETTRRLAGLFGHPEQAYQTYHIAGSKGKGSVARMLACVLDEAENAAHPPIGVLDETARLSTGVSGEVENAAHPPIGVYASPHIYDFRERFSTPGGFLPEQIYTDTTKEFFATFNQLADAELCDSWPILGTIFAFLTFRKAGCRHAVFEVGMGGRLDPTNIIMPRICLITEIELEHTKFLGDTLEQIAAEKAGIIKAGAPVVIARQQQPSVDEVFRQVARNRHAPIYFVDDLARIESAEYQEGRLVVKMSSSLFSRPVYAKLQMLAKVQAQNALQVAVAAKVLDPDLPEAVIERGLARATLPGRFEIRHTRLGDHTIVLDGAHTAASIRSTLDTFNTLFASADCGARNLLLAITDDKKIQQVIPLFKNQFAHIFVTKPPSFKTTHLQVIQEAFRCAGVPAEFNEDCQATIKKALALSDTLLVTGSFYLLEAVDQIVRQSAL